MEKITFVIPSRNNLEFLKLAYESIRNLETEHEVLVLDDASTDGTKEWICEVNDPNLFSYINKGPERIGIVGMFDKGIEMASTDIIMAFHADMVAAPKLDENILKHLTRGTVVSATRVEPPLHPPGPEKITHQLGTEIEQFSMEEWKEWSTGAIETAEKITEGIFAPWCMYKKDFEAIGGHDALFAPQSREDSDLFNRFQLAGYKFIQPWNALVYHFTSRGSRFNKHAGGDTMVDSPEWQRTNSKNMRNFVRKWGTQVQHDHYMKPIITPKYDIGLIVNNCGINDIGVLEPWCSTLYTDGDIAAYIDAEQPNTNINLLDKIKPYDSEKNNNILIKFDASLLNNERFGFITKLPHIITDSGSIGSSEYDIFIIDIINMKNYQEDLINA